MTTTIKGLILDATTKKGISNLTIEAWEQDVKVSDLTGKVVTDSEGRFALTFDESYWKDNAQDRHPIVFFRVYDAAGNLLRDTQHQIYWTEEQQENPIAIAIGEAAKFVFGKVVLETGKPAANVVVRVYQKSLKIDRIIAASTTNNSGDYSISYPAEGVDNIIVRVFNPKGKTPIAASPVVFNVKEKEEVNLSVASNVYQSASLYESIEQSLAAILGDLEVTTLDADQIKLLAHESGIERKELLVYQNAQALSKGHHLSAEVFFAVLQNDMETSEDKLFAVSEEQLKHILAKSWDEHLISKDRAAELLNELSVHEKLSVQHQLQYTSFTSKITLLETWNSLKLSAAQLNTVGSALKSSGGNSREFWDTIRKDKNLTALLPKMEFLAQLKNLTLGNLTLINKIGQNKAIYSLSEMAGLSHSKWVQIIGSAPIPEEIVGKPDERIHIYATSMKRMVDYLYPTNNVMVSYATDTANHPIVRADYSLFFQNNPGFLLEKDNLDAYLKKNPKALAGLQNKEAFKREMGTTIRLFRLSPAIDRYESMASLTKMGVSSAQDITQKGFSAFQSEFSALLGDYTAAQLIYRNAQHYSAVVSTLMMSFTSDHDIQMYVYNNNIKQDATWQTLFGSEDYCGCQHCKSVYSPAAYLADSLHFLENRKQTNGSSFYKILDARRPDIKHILLNCENANTAMPYIDLVNEVLEAAVIQQDMLAEDFVGFQTTRSMDELMANPEHLEEGAYTVLKGAKYPWSMPFDFYNRLGKTYLQHLGVKHHKLVKLFPFAENTLPPHPTAQELLIFKEKRNIKAVLGLNDIDWDILMGINYDALEESLWGTNGRISSLVSDTLEKTQLSLEDLKILIDTKFVNPDGKLEIKYADLCSIEGASLKNYTRSTRKHMLQLVRLRHKLNTDLRTVDHILNALSAQEINAFTLNSIAQLVRWQESYNLPYSELVTWVGNLPTANRKDDENHRELYEQTFLTHFEGNNESARDFFVLSDSKKQLRNETRTLNGVIRNYISGALQISSADLDAIITILPTNKLTLANLSVIYGTLSLARTLHLSVSEILGLRDVIAANSTERIQEFQAICEARADVQKSGLSVTEVLYLFGKSEEGKMADQRKIEILQEIREGLWKLKNQGMEDNGLAPLMPEDFLFEKLGSTFGMDRNVIVLLLNLSENADSYLVYTRPNGPKSYMKSLLDPHGFLSQDAVALLQVGMFPELEELCEQLNKISLLYKKLKFTTEHYRTLLTAIGKSKWFDFNRLGHEATYSAFAELLQINEIVGETGRSEVNVFELLNSTAVDANWKNNTARLLGYADGAALGTMAKAFDIDDLTNTDAIQGAACYLNLLSAKALENYLGVSIAEYTNSTGKFVLAQSELDKDRVMKIVRIAKSKYGEERWQNVTKQLRDVLREEQRDALLTFLMATKKDASENPLNTPEKLYAHLLIDTEMSACTVTSRIRLALSSVQLFAQRCLMNLESEASLQGISQVEQEEWKEWTWRKNYRVWEANRKVFLYPENWLEPEWRDDKTPFFKELESELQQNELTNENAESAYLNYLYKLESVSNLEILAMCEAEKVDDVLSGYYIFGRTRENPKRLYFRKVSKILDEFSPWELIDVGFDGDHLVPCIYNGQLHLFWPSFHEQTKDLEQNPDGTGTAAPLTYWSITLNWTSLKNKIWESKKVNDQAILENTEMLGRDLLNENARKKMITLTFQSGVLRIYHQWGLFESSSILGTYKRIAQYNFNGLHLTKVDSFQKHEYVIRTFKNGRVLEYENQRLPSEIDSLNVALIAGQLTLVDPVENDLVIIPCQYQELRTPELIPFIIQNNDISIIWNQSSGKYELRALQHKIHSTFILDVSLHGIHSDYTKNHWKNYQTEPLVMTEFMNVQLDSVVNPEEVQKDILPLKQGSFSQYNWELFFHIPMHVANKLRQDQKFEEAQKWFHYVFDPTSSEATNAPKKFWVFQPFRDYVCSGEDGTPCSIQELMQMLNEESEISGFQVLEQTVHAWERNPFSPHTVARTRVIAYMKWVVMRYIDNLIEWADQLFRRDSIESLNEATQLYMLAWNILGEAPHAVTAKEREDQSYSDLQDKLDEFSNALVALTDRIPVPSTNQSQGQSISMMSANAPQIDVTDLTLVQPKVPQLINQGQENLLPVNTLYFCIPQNEKLLGYWDLVRDRFFKLRHCLNIEGVYRQLPLYEPPIDPALLIQARANGLSIADALSAAYTPTSHYRFLVLLQKAIDYANDVRVFGGALLSALEKRDAEEMVALRSMHEVQLLNEVTLVRKEQINELRLSNQSLDYSMANIENRRAYYAEKEFMSSEEKSQQNMLRLANTYQILGQSLSLLAAATRPIPDISAGYSGIGGHFVTNVGGEKAAASIDLMAQAYSMFSGIAQIDAASSGQTAAYNRRSEDWKFQESTAEIEIKQIEKQILAAQIRMSIAQQELKNHELQVENSTKQLELVQAKFTSYELYDWMVGQLKTLYFQSYQMAFDMAKKAESALSFEHGIGTTPSETFIKFGYWDNLKEGLLSGEKLHHDLKRMEMIYMQRNERRHEVSKTVSLAMIDAEELGRLRATGECDLTVPEILFDLDFPQHGNRKIKSVSITIPAITGPYTGINAVLSTTNSGSIAVTGSQNDAGLFQFSFNDERYLPFEGMRFEPVEASDRTISFHLRMNDKLRTFDYNTITDVLLHIHYTAEDLYLNETDLDKKIGNIRTKLANNKFTQLISVKNDFANEWFEAKTANDATLSLPRNRIKTPYFLRNEGLPITAKFAVVDSSGELNLDWANADVLAAEFYLDNLNFEEMSDLILVIQHGGNLEPAVEV